MAQYSVELRHVISERGNIFNFPYEFYNEEKREKFEQDFIRHFYFREIGAETIDRFLVFLEDKFNTVFPYYNKLFEATEIEYDILDNYKLKETITVNRENVGSSTSTGTSNNTQTSESSESGNTSHSGTDTGSTSETANGSNSETRNDKKRFLDTPQGQTDLTNSKYLTTLNDDDSTSSGSSETEKTGTTSNTSESSDTSESSSNGTVTDAGRTETSVESTGSTSETTTLERRGNIGVDTDSDGIIKHLKLQKMLAEIQKLFFNECEDLFMLVY